jgi:hypothetical protein
LAIAVDGPRTGDNCTIDVLYMDDLSLAVPIGEVSGYRELSVELESASAAA